MNAAVVNKIIESYTLIYVEVDENSNKVWKGSILENGSFLAEWGRVGSKLQSKKHEYKSVTLAQRKLEQMKNQKLRKGYTYARVIDNDRPLSIPLEPQELENIAATQIHHGEDARAKELIKYLVEVNIHQIVSQTQISYDATTGNWKTPLGLVTLDAIAKARMYLAEMTKSNRKSSLRQLISKYLRLIPQNLGRKLDESVFCNDNELQRQFEILNSLEIALQMGSQQVDRKVFECTLRRVPGSTDEGKKTFRWIRNLYESTINQNHLSATYKLRRIYKIDIPSMRQAFELKSKQIGNIKLHWHGTKASNLLSILRQGLIIPPANAVYCTGRMFGNGIYGSEQSTKSLNYATNYWNQSGNSNQKVFMLLCDFALGKEYHPQNLNVSYPVSGYDSTYIAPGNANIINQESIVYNTDQVNIKYLCAFDVT
ncbi:MAG: WGR domain-containing protein [Prochloraceae cyanobacterium]|nr:WGR domain-containing protein [Prochloraceae cyanobacterium]